MRRLVAVPRVVSRVRQFNDLRCQTSLTALKDAKGIFLNCKTGSMTRDHVRFTPESELVRCN